MPIVNYHEESSRSDVRAVDWTEDIKVTFNICAKRVTVSQRPGNADLQIGPHREGRPPCRPQTLRT